MRVAIIGITPDVRTLGPLNLSTYLHARGYPNSFIYFLAPYLEKIPAAAIAETAAFLARQESQVIGISLTTFYFDTARDLTAAIRAAVPSALIVWGGIHPTISPQECLEHCDIACRGEGEEAMLELLQHLDAGKDHRHIPSLWVKQGGEVFENDIRPLCQDLDSRPFPRIDWDGSYIVHDQSLVGLTPQLFDRYRPKQSTVYEVMATRGCPLACTYCCNSTFRHLFKGKGQVLRFRSVDHIIAELKYVKETFPKVQVINFEDDALGSSPEDFLAAFCDAYRREIGLPFHIRIIPRFASDEKIAIMKKAGLVGAVMGLQGSDRINKEVYKRPTTGRHFVHAAQLLRKHGVVGRYDVIIDNPYSNERDEIEAIETFMAVPKPFHLYVYPLAYFPGTKLTSRVIADGLYAGDSAGYAGLYGSDKHRYPELAQLIKMVPFTPKFLMKLFLFIRRWKLGKAAIAAYYSTVFRCEERVIHAVMGNAGRLLMLRKLLLRPTA